jgi:hypothetical protein
MTRETGDQNGAEGREAVPLSEDEQRILKEIEANLSATDPALVQQVSETTLYRHASRTIKWAVIGFLAGLLLLIFTFTRALVLGVVGFLVMLGCLLVIERNVRKMGKAGIESFTTSMRGGALKGKLGDAGRKWRERWRRDEGN